MKIIIKDRQGQYYRFNLDPNNLVKELKLEIHKKLGIPINQHYLLLGDLRLEDNSPLKNFNFEESAILLIKTDESLLLKSSIIFSGSNLIDRIHQSIIDIEAEPKEENVQELLNEAISYLDYDLDLRTGKELFSLVISCFSHFPIQSLKTFDKRLQKSKISINHILIMASILLYLAQYQPELSISNYDSFISGSYEEIIAQDFNNDESTITMLGCDIPQQFKVEFITNIILLTKFTQEIVLTVYPYIFSHKSTPKSKLNFFITKVLEAELISVIPESFIIQNDLFLNFSIDNLHNIIFNLSEQTFRKIYPVLEDTIINGDQLTLLFSITFILKCVEFDIIPDSIDILLEQLDFIDVKSPIWEYLNKHDIKLPEEVAAKIDTYPRSPFVLKIIPNPEILPQEFLTFALLEASDFNIYESVFSKKIECKVISTYKFWSHILHIASTKDCSFHLMNRFAFYFASYISPSEMIDIFDHLIFDRFPPNERQSNFLVSLLNNLPNSYISNYYEAENMFLLVSKLFNFNRIPPASLCSLFKFEFLPEQITPYFLYEYELSYKKKCFPTLNSLEILPYFEKSNQIIIDFIKENNNFGLIKNIDKETLSLIASSLVFTSNETPLNIAGLTINNILPFYAISFNHITNCHNHNLAKNTPTQMLELLIESCKSMETNASKLMNESINSILRNMDSLFCQAYFSMDIAFLMIEIMWNLLLKGKYTADKSLLISVIFMLSKDDNDFILQESSVIFFQKHGDQIFKYIMQNLEIINNNVLNDFKLNLNLFDTKMVIQILVESIQNTSSNETVYHTIIFLLYNVKYPPEIFVNNVSGINQVLQKVIDEEEWNDASNIIDFMNKRRIEINKKALVNKKICFNICKELFKITDYSNAIEIVNQILFDPQPKNNSYSFKMLFHFLLKDPLTSANHIAIILESFTSNQILEPSMILQNMSNLYFSHFDIMQHTLHHFYAFSSAKKIFIRKIFVDPLPQPNIDFSFLVKLIEENSYQSFICLKNIAFSFPFFFDHNPMKVIEMVFLTFDPLLNTEDEEETIKNWKKSYAAIGFLYSCLHSTRFISVFVNFAFQKIAELSQSQVYMLTSFILSLFKTKKVNHVVFALAYKYNFLNTLINLLKQSFPEKFRDIYYSNLYDILTEYYILFMEMFYSDALFIEQVSNDTIQNPFEIKFNNFSTILPISIEPFKMQFPEDIPFDEEISTFHHFIDAPNNYWVSTNNLNDQQSEDELLNTFNSFNEFNKENNFVFQKVPSAPPIKTVKMQRFLVTQPQWICDWIDNKVTFPILSNHYEYLNEVINFLNTIKKEKGIENRKYFDRINPFDYFGNQIYHKELFSELIKELSDSSRNKHSIIELLQQITKSHYASSIFLNVIYENFSKAENNLLSVDILIRQIYILNKLFKDNYSMRRDFFDDYSSKLIEIVLSPDFRSDKKLLFKTTKLLSKYNNTVPINATHLISFLFIANDLRINKEGFDLYLKISSSKSANLIPIIETSFNNSLTDNIPFADVKFYLNKLPFLTNNCIQMLNDYLNKIIIEFKSCNYNDLDLSNKICELFNYLTPKRDSGATYRSPRNYSKTKILLETQSTKTLLNSAPQSVVDKSPIFWNEVYEQHRVFLSNFIEKDERIIERLRLLNIYHELIPFRFRSSIFKKHIRDRIRNRCSIRLAVSRTNILIDSFNILSHRRPEDFLSKFHVDFIGEVGVDAGGLTRDWFSSITKELFNPNIGLFQQTGNGSFHPNSLSYINENHITYFRMAGSIIARALLGGQCVDAHLSIAFLKQILHQKICLQDLEEYDEPLFKSLQLILGTNDVEDLDLYFQIDDEQFGKVFSVDLIKGGGEIQVTNENKHEYADLYAEYKLRNSMIKQIDAFCSAFDAIIPPKYIKLFSPGELDLMICGIPKIDINDLKKHIHYRGEYNSKHRAITKFFNVISKWDQENLAKFLLFLTGSSQVPLNGFKHFEENDKPIKISSTYSKNRLPVAHTCFNTLDLPDYDSEEEMNRKLLMAIQEAEFGLS